VLDSSAKETVESEAVQQAKPINASSSAASVSGSQGPEFTMMIIVICTVINIVVALSVCLMLYPLRKSKQDSVALEGREDGRDLQEMPTPRTVSAASVISDATAQRLAEPMTLSMQAAGKLTPQQAPMHHDV
jgi:hypothetical protein